MARKTISQLSASFKTGDIPVGQDFLNIFESNFNLQETGTSVASGSLNVLTDITASKYSGDGSALTGVSSFPFTGDAVITGSLLISGSGQFRMDSDDVVLGAGAGRILDANTSNNVLIGNKAGYDITTGDNNVILGQSAGENTNADADDNIILGYQAGYNAISKNILIGTQAGQGGASYNNVIIGYQAGYSATSNTAYNVIIGYQAGFDTTGQYNTVIGYTAGQDIDAGDHNINIGYDVSSTSGTDNELLIGKQTTIAISASLDTGNVLFPQTASAGHFIGDGSGLSNLPGGGIFSTTGGYEQTINNLIISSSNSTSSLSIVGSGSTVFDIEGSVGTLFSAVDSLSGSLMSVTDASGIPILEVFSDATVEIKGFKGYRPIQTQASSFVLQLSDMGTYNRCGGVAITASLSASSAIPFAIGTEIEFFQTSSAGNLLITASAGSGITLNSKDGNLKLAGQFSAATLKKVGTNEWDLVGDLTS